MLVPSFVHSLKPISNCVNIGFFRQFHFSTKQYTHSKMKVFPTFFVLFTPHLSSFVSSALYHVGQRVLSKSTSEILFRLHRSLNLRLYFANFLKPFDLASTTNSRFQFVCVVFSKDFILFSIYRMLEREKQWKTLLILNFLSESCFKPNIL